MALKEIPVVKFEYELTELGFKGIRFTKSSDKMLNLADAVKFAAGQNAVLQSLCEAAVFYMHAPLQRNGSSYPPSEDNADRSQLTRTVGIGFKEGNKNYFAYDDIPDPEKNLILARAQEGLKASTSRSRWELPKDDRHVVQILERAEKARRIVKEHSGLFLAKAIRAALGPIAKAYNTWFYRNHGYGIDFGLPDIPRDEKAVVVQPLFLDNGRINIEPPDGCGCIPVDHFNIGGYSRGVRLPSKTSEAQEASDLEKAVVALKEQAAFRMNGTMYIPVKREIIEKAK